jgi:hypothetical protein
MPRIEADSTEVSPENGELESRLTFGVRFVSELMSVTPFARRVSVVNALIAIGTFWMSCSRFCAVTMISSSTCCADADALSSVDATALQSKALRRADRLLVVVPDSRCFRENRSPPLRMPSPVRSRLPMCSPC